MSIKKTNTYTQCLMTRGPLHRVSWIPTYLAIKGNFLEMQDKKTREWIDGWLIFETYDTQPAEYVEEHERDYLKQRQASDI